MDGWEARLADIDPGFKLQVGWDKQTEHQLLAAKDEQLTPAAQKDQVVSESGKTRGLGLEKEMLYQFRNEESSWPPLNNITSPGRRDRDRKTGHGIADDIDDREDGEVEMGDASSAEIQAAIAADKTNRAAKLAS